MCEEGSTADFRVAFKLKLRCYKDFMWILINNYDFRGPPRTSLSKVHSRILTKAHLKIERIHLPEFL